MCIRDSYVYQKGIIIIIIIIIKEQSSAFRVSSVNLLSIINVIKIQCKMHVTKQIVGMELV